MSYSIPDEACRLQTTVFVQESDLYAVGRERVIQEAAENLSRHAMRKLLNDCVEVEGIHTGNLGKTLLLDVYVMSPKDVKTMLRNAYEKGSSDALVWMPKPEVEA